MDPMDGENKEGIRDMKHTLREMQDRMGGIHDECLGKVLGLSLSQALKSVFLSRNA